MFQAPTGSRNDETTSERHSSRREFLGQVGATAACSAIVPPCGAQEPERETVLVAGATGRSGVEVTRALLESGRFSPLGLVRAGGKGSKAKVFEVVPTFECDVTAPDAR